MIHCFVYLSDTTECEKTRAQNGKYLCTGEKRAFLQTVVDVNSELWQL